MPAHRAIPHLLTITFTAFGLGGCAQSLTSKSAAVPCSAGWNQQVDAQLNSGDGQGHGPDVGSLEWRGVVEFKLGLRNQTGRPPLQSDDWCQDIDQRLHRERP